MSEVKAFTAEATNILNVLKTPVKLTQAFDPSKIKIPPSLTDFEAIWDTGATNTAISQKVVNALALKPIGVMRVNGIHGEKLCNTFFIGIMLPNGTGFPQVRVAVGELGNVDVLIGMDIITQGDFAITNYQGKTTFTFRTPSLEHINFLKPSREKIKTTEKIGRNAPCLCGSGKKYKKCCGK